MNQTACKLCGSNGPLSDSHILPEFVYRPAYDTSHSATAIDLEQGRQFIRQKGFTERLLCANCESRFSRWESYFARIWLHPDKQLRPRVIAPGTIEIAGLDYASFKLFHMSVVWRSGVSQMDQFKNVNLRGQEEKLRRRLLASDPGEWYEYPFFGVALRDAATAGFQDQIVKAPTASRVGGFWAYTFLFGGVLWHYIVSDNARNSVVPVFFNQTGVLTLSVQDWTENYFVRDFASRLQSMSGRFGGKP